MGVDILQESKSSFLLFDPEEEVVLDGGFEPRKGRVWIGLRDLRGRYFSYLARSRSLVFDIKKQAAAGKISDPDKYTSVHLDRMKFIEGMVLYKMTTKTDGRVVFEKIGTTKELFGGMSE